MIQLIPQKEQMHLDLILQLNVPVLVECCLNRAGGTRILLLLLNTDHLKYLLNSYYLKTRYNARLAFYSPVLISFHGLLKPDNRSVWEPYVQEALQKNKSMFTFVDKLGLLTDIYPETVEATIETCSSLPLIILENSASWPTLLFGQHFYVPDRDGQIRPGAY